MASKTSLEVVQDVFSVWGSGAYTEDSGDGKHTANAAAIAEQFADDCYLDASGESAGGNHQWAHTKGYREYEGLAGAGDWLVFLTGMQFPDFEVLNMTKKGPQNVIAKVSYTPTVSATGKTAPGPMADTQTWTVSGGKVTSVLFNWSQPEVLDSLFDGPPVLPTTTNKTSLEVVQDVFSVWGSGAYTEDSGDGKHTANAAAIAEQFADDCYLDASGNCAGGNHQWAHTKGYREYEGLAGAGDWLVFLTGMQFPDFEVLNMTKKGPQNVIATVSYTPTVSATGKTAPGPMADTQTWTVSGGKVTSVLFNWSQPEVLDSLFAGPPVLPTTTNKAVSRSGTPTRSRQPAPEPAPATAEEGIPPVSGAAATSLEPALPEGWESDVSRSTGGTYYVNTLTGESCWEVPTQPAALSVDRQELEANAEAALNEGNEAAASHYINQLQDVVQQEEAQVSSASTAPAPAPVAGGSAATAAGVKSPRRSFVDTLCCSSPRSARRKEATQSEAAVQVGAYYRESIARCAPNAIAA
jgi:hypothetical protein